MLEMNYSINEITDSAIEIWHIESSRRKNIYRQISREIQRENLNPIAVKNDKKTSLYHIHDINDFIIYTLGDYFSKISQLSGEDINRLVGLSPNDFADIERSEEDITISGVEAAHKFEGNPALQNRFENTELQQSVIRQRENRMFHEKKMEIMIEALFNERYTLNIETLKNDIHEVVTFDTASAHSTSISRSVESARLRLNSSLPYYSIKDE